MKYSDADWAEKRRAGLARYLLFDGILITGGPFAVVMQVVGYFLLRQGSQTFGEYFSSPQTWITFFFHATLFGSIIGYINWYRSEKTYRSRADRSRISTNEADDS